MPYLDFCNTCRRRAERSVDGQVDELDESLIERARMKNELDESLIECARMKNELDESLIERLRMKNELDESLVERLRLVLELKVINESSSVSLFLRKFKKYDCYASITRQSQVKRIDEACSILKILVSIFFYHQIA